MRSINEKKSWVQDFDSAKTFYEDLEVIYEFFKEDEATLDDVETRFEKAQVSTILEIENSCEGPFNSRNSFIIFSLFFFLSQNVEKKKNVPRISVKKEPRVVCHSRKVRSGAII